MYAYYYTDHMQKKGKEKKENTTHSEIDHFLELADHCSLNLNWFGFKAFRSKNIFIALHREQSARFLGAA